MTIPTFDITRGACRRPGVDPDLFFDIGERGRPTIRRREEAKAICRPCPVRDECLTWALDTGDIWAVLGGTTGDERRAVLSRTDHAPVATNWRDCANPTCTQEFYSANPDQRYCKPRCREADEARQRRARRTCANPECAQEFVPPRANNTCCSPYCSNRATHLKQRDRNRVAA
jgi:WhiB family redox-sensing transcriptional regulator